MFFDQLPLHTKLYIASEVLKRSKEDCFANTWVTTVEMEEIARVHLQDHKPLAKIFKKKNFWKYQFYTDENTLDPRPETEFIIEHIVNNLHGQIQSILDLGTGTGNLILSLLKDLPRTQGFAIDISMPALKNAQINASNLEIDYALCQNIELIQKYSNRLIFIHNDWLQNWHKPVDLLVTNPPYLDFCENNHTLKFDPYIALFEEPKHKYLNDIHEKMYLFKHIYIEINPSKLNQGKILFPKAQIIYDYHNLPRILYINNT